MAIELNSYYFFFDWDGVEDNLSATSTRVVGSTKSPFWAELYGPLLSATYELQSLTVNGSNGPIVADEFLLEFSGELETRGISTPGTFFSGQYSQTKSVSVNSKNNFAVARLDAHESRGTYSYHDEGGYLTQISGSAFKVTGSSAFLYSAPDHMAEEGFPPYAANFMGPVTVNGKGGVFAGVDLINTFIATELSYDYDASDPNAIRPVVDLVFESKLELEGDSDITSFTGAALKVLTSGSTGGDAYLGLDDSLSGAITLSTGNRGGAYATVIKSDVLNTHTVVAQDASSSSFTATGAAINILSKSGDAVRDITPGQSYIDWLTNSVYFPLLNADSVSYDADFALAWDALTDKQKSYVFMSDLLSASGAYRGDPGSYYTETLDADIYDPVKFAEDNDTKVGAFLVLADATSGAINTRASGGSSTVVMRDAIAMTNYTGDLYEEAGEIQFGSDSLSAASVNVTGKGAYFSATNGSALGALTVNGLANEVIVSILDSDVITNAVEGDFYLGKNLGFTNGDYYSDKMADITGGRISATTRYSADFSLENAVSGQISLTGREVTAYIYEAEVATSLDYTEVGDAVVGDTLNFKGASTTIKATGTGSNDINIDSSRLGALNVSGKASSITSIINSVFTTSADYDYKWWLGNPYDPLEVSAEITERDQVQAIIDQLPEEDAREWKQWIDLVDPTQTVYNTEHIKNLTGAAVKVGGSRGDSNSSYSALLTGENNLMGAVTVSGSLGSAAVTLDDSFITSNLSYTGDSEILTDMGYRNSAYLGNENLTSPITSFTGAALKVLTSGSTGGDAYLGLDDSLSGAITLSTGNRGGAYATVIQSDVLNTHTVVAQDASSSSFTATGAAINILSKSGDAVRDITPGQSYIDWLTNSVYFPLLNADSVSYDADFALAWDALTDKQKSYVFMSDLLSASGAYRGDPGSYYTETLDADIYDPVKFAEDNDTKVGAFLVLADATSGAINTRASGGSSTVVMRDAIAMTNYTGDLYEEAGEIQFGSDSLSAASVNVTGKGAYFSATNGSALGALTVNGLANEVIVSILDSDVITNAVEGDFYLGKNLGFTNGDYYSDKMADITGGRISATTRYSADFSLENAVSGQISLTGREVTAYIYEAEVATSLDYTEVGDAVVGDTLNFKGASTTIKATGTGSNDINIDSSRLGALNVSATRGSADVGIMQSIMATSADYDYKWWLGNPYDPLEVSAEITERDQVQAIIDQLPEEDAREWKQWIDLVDPTQTVYNTEHITNLTGAAVNIIGKGGSGVDFYAFESIMGNVTINSGSKLAEVDFYNSIIASSLYKNDSSPDFTFENGTVRIFGGTATVTLSNSYLSLLDLTKVKYSSEVKLSYNDNDADSYLSELLNPLNPDELADPQLPPNYTPVSNPDSFDVKLKVNRKIDKILIDVATASETQVDVVGFEWGRDEIYTYTFDAESLEYVETKINYLDNDFEAYIVQNSLTSITLDLSEFG